MRNGGRRIVNFTVTNFCNASCVYCSFHKEPDKKMVSPADARRAIDYLSENEVGMLSLTGGEPLLNPGLPDMVRHAARRDMLVFTGTNGILLTKELAARLKEAGLSSMWISYESDSPQEFEKNRGVPGLHKRVGQAARDLRAAGLDFYAIALINKSLRDVGAFADRLLEMGFDKVKFDYPMGFELQSTYRGWSRSPLLKYSGDDMARMVDSILRLKRGGRIRVLNPVGGLLGARSFFKGEGGRFPCYAGEKILYMDVDLDIYRCPALAEKLGSVGDELDFGRKECDLCYYQGVRDFGSFYYLLETVGSVGRAMSGGAFVRPGRLLRALADANDLRGNMTGIAGGEKHPREGLPQGGRDGHR